MSNNNDPIMVDLETWGTGPNSAILAIGAVKFDPSTNTIGDELYCVVDKQSCIDVGLEVDLNTEIWWDKQSPEAKTVLSQPGIPLTEALLQLQSFCGRNVCVWGNGAGFDNVILENAYKKTNIFCPWEFWNNRCYRTIKNMFPEIRMDRFGIHHNAVDDAKSQALHLMKILAKLMACKSK